MSALLDAAVSYAVRDGWPLVPLHGKNPGIWGKEEDWTQYATSDPDTLATYAVEKRPTGWGVYLPAAGLVCVDLDDLSKRGAVEQLGVRFDCGLVVRSGRGGLHAYYRRPTGWTAERWGNKRIGGIEMRANGQQVLPPSRHPNGNTYEWLHHDAVIPELPAAVVAARERGGATVDASRHGDLLIVAKKAAKAAVIDHIATLDLGDGRTFSTTEVDGLANAGTTYALKDMAGVRGDDRLSDPLTVEIEPVAGKDATDHLAAGHGAVDHTPTVGAVPTTGSRLVAISTVKRRYVEYLDEDGLIPRAMLSLLVGDPGLGKSTYCCYMTARVTKAGGSVIYQTAEDSYSAVVRPRLEAAGAVLERVYFIELAEDAPIWLPEHLETLDRHVGEIGADLVIIDPLMAFLPESVNSHRDQSIRGALRPLHELAERRSCTTLVAAHLNKGQGTGIHRVGGSIGLTGAARSVLLLGRDPHNPDGSDRVLVHWKCNVGPEQGSQLWRLENVLLPAEDPHPETVTSKIVKLGASTLTSRDVLATPLDKEGMSAKDDAVEFLRTELGDGPVSAKAIEELARQAGISDSTLRRAKTDLGVRSRKDDFGDGAKWLWTLPNEDAQGDQAGMSVFVDEHLRGGPDFPHNQAVLDQPIGLRAHEGAHYQEDQRLRLESALNGGPFDQLAVAMEHRPDVPMEERVADWRSVETLGPDDPRVARLGEKYRPASPTLEGTDRTLLDVRSPE